MRRCFGWFSKFDVTEPEDEPIESIPYGGQDGREEARHLRKYEERMARMGEPDDQPANPKKATHLDFVQHFFCYDIRARILFGTLFAIFVGVGIPLIIYFSDKPQERDEIYGSCFLKQEFRVKCLPNQLADPTEDDCIAAKCCWNGNQSLPFNCFHSLTSSYHYFVSNLHRSPSNFTTLEKVELDLNPNLQDRMRRLKVHIEWQSQEHLNAHIFDPKRTRHNSAALVGTEAKVRDAQLDTQELSLNYATNGEYFFLKIERNDSREIIFDTRLGPLIAGQDYISFATELPSPYFYGLKGALSGGEATYDNFNSYGPSDFPFYLAFEPASGHVHGLLLDTIAPYVTQYMEAPGLLFHLQGHGASLDLHFFVGPTVKDVYRQLHRHLKSKEEVKDSPPRLAMPPYWALGLHLCRTAVDHKDALLQINATRHVPYDSDCIDENFRSPFQIDESRYPPEETQAIIDYLKARNLRVLLSQKVVIPCDGTDLANPLLKLIMWNETHPFVGLLDAERPAYYPDYLAPDAGVWLQDEFDGFNASELFGGLIVLENYPLTYNLSGLCEKDSETESGSGPSRVKSRLQANFVTLAETKMGLICPDALHLDAPAPPTPHFDVHNLYGHQSALKIRASYESSLDSESDASVAGQRLVFTSSSIWTNTLHYAGFNGPEVPFTWEGMTESLAYILRNFMFMTYVGTPICGSYLPSSLDPSDTNDLCFRWFQLGLLLPFARNSHSVDGPKGVLVLSATHQDRVIKNIRQRYKYNPYYYTLFYEYEAAMAAGADDGKSEPEPHVRPLLFDFPQASSNLTFRITTQFMIGPALMAVPILTRSSQREAYFPPGNWYNLAGKLQWSNEGEGGLIQVEGFQVELPIYLRGGHVIAALEEPVLADNAMDSRAGNYSILATYPTPAHPESRGQLFMDDGLQADSIEVGAYDLLVFEATNSSLTIETTLCGLPREASGISRIINQIKVFGFPRLRYGVTVEAGLDGSTAEPVPFSHSYDPENGVLHIQDVWLQWCTQFNELTVAWEFGEAGADAESNL